MADLEAFSPGRVAAHYGHVAGLRKANELFKHSDMSCLDFRATHPYALGARGMLVNVLVLTIGSPIPKLSND